MSTHAWVPVMPAADVVGPPWPCHDVAGTSLRLVRDADGGIHAVGAACPHLDSPLDRAEIEDGQLLCPRHWYAYDLVTGINQHPGLDHSDALAVHPVEIRGGIVHVAIDDPT